MECLAEMPQAPLDRRPRKRQRLGWDVGPEIHQVQIGLCGQEVASVITAMTLGLSSGGIVSSQETLELPRFASPPIREDDKDGHYVFAVGDNLTSRHRINAKMGEAGTFGQVLECWDRERKETVAIKIIRGIKKYRDAAMIEIGMLEQLGKYDKSRSRRVLALLILFPICVIFLLDPHHKRLLPRTATASPSPKFTKQNSEN